MPRPGPRSGRSRSGPPTARPAVSSSFACCPAARTCWYWAALVRAGQPLLHVNDWEAPLPRVGLAVRSRGAVGRPRVRGAVRAVDRGQRSTYAVALDDPADALGRALRHLGSDGLRPRVVRHVGPDGRRGRLRAAGRGPRRSRAGRRGARAGGGSGTPHAPLGDALAPWSPEPAVAHLGLRAVARVPDETVVDLVLTADGWRSRVPRSP